MYSQKVESGLQVARIFIVEKHFVQIFPILHFRLNSALPQISPSILSFSPQQLLLISRNLLYLKNEAEIAALSNFFLYGHLKVNQPLVYPVKSMIDMVRESSPKLSEGIKIVTQISPYSVLPKINIQLVILYSSAIILAFWTISKLLWLFRNGYLTRKQLYLLLSQIKNRIFNFFQFLYLFLSRLLHRLKTTKTGIGSLPEKIVSKAIDVDSSLPLPIDFLTEVQGILNDINDTEKCKLFIAEMMQFGENGVVQVNEYKYTLKVLRSLRKMFREYEADGKTELISEVAERIILSKNTLKSLATSIQRIARVFRRKTELYTSCLDLHEELEALDDALFDRIQEIFKIFISFCKKYGIELNE
jgi:hypothetical protein